MALGKATAGKEALFERLRAIDPKTAARLHPNDLRRVVRAIEVFEKTGRPISEMQREWAEWVTLIATVSFIPFEIVEVVRKPTPVRWAVIAINVAIAIYLLLRRLKTRLKKKRLAISGLASPFSIR